MSIRSLNEAFEKMFEEISEEETFNEDFDVEYAQYVTEIGDDSEVMYKMYKTGNVAPSDALKTLGYVDGEGDTMVCEINSNGINYTKVFDFNGAGVYKYYVLQDGNVPSGWAITTAALDEEFLQEALESAMSQLTEAEMSDEDRRDSDHIRSMLDKMQARSNASFSPEEKAVMDKYGITRNNNSRNLYVGTRELDRRVDSKAPSYYSRHQYSNGTQSKINYADRARKLPQREPNQIFTNPWTADNDDINAHGGSLTNAKNLQDAERYAPNIPMRDKMSKMRSALDDRKRYQRYIDGADAEREAAVAAAKKKYDAEVASAEKTYKWNTEDSARYRDRAQSDIDDMLKRGKKESITESIDEVKQIKNYIKSWITGKFDGGGQNSAFFATYLEEGGCPGNWEKIAEVAYLMGYDVYKTSSGYFGDDDYLIVMPGENPEIYTSDLDDDAKAMWSDMKDNLVKID